MPRRRPGFGAKRRCRRLAICSRWILCSIQRMERDGAAAYFSFDGKDDFLGISGKSNSVKAITIFLLAAPKGNPGNFSALFGAARAGQNDYTSGLNLDFGPTPTKELSVINVESAGSIGFRD